MRKFAFALLAIFFATSSFAQETSEAPEAPATPEVQDVQATQDTGSTTDDNTKVAAAPRKSFSWGVKANINMASERNAPESKFRTGLAAGFFAEIKINETLSFQPELLYSQQGSRQYLIKGVSTRGDIIFQFDYINLPLLLKIYVWKDKLSLEVGPQFGYMVRHKEKRQPRNQAKITRELDKDWVNEFDVAAAIGVSYKVYGPFDLYARYTYGFMDIYKGDIADMIYKEPQKGYFVDDKNSVIQAGVAARF